MSSKPDLYQSLFEAASEAILLLQQNQVIAANASALALFGCSRAELVGRTMKKFLPPTQPDGQKSGQAYRARTAAALAGQPQQFEWSYRRLSGESFAVWVGLKRIEAGGETYLQATLQVPADDKQPWDTLGGEAWFRSAFEDAAIGLALTRLDGRFAWVNRAWCDIVGYSEQELQHLTFQQITHPDDLELNMEVVRRLISGEVNSFEMEKRYLHKLGQVIWVQLNTSLLRDAQNTPLYFITQCQDVTRRRQVDDELRKLYRAVEQSPASIVITDLSGAIEYVNPKFTQVTGYTAEEARGNNPRILKSGEKSSQEYRELWATITAGQEWRGEFHNKKKNGELFWEYAFISPITDAAGEITHFLAIKEDITERKRVEEEIIRERDYSRMLVEGANALVVGLDSQGQVTVFNKTAERITGYSLADLQGRNWFEVLVPQDRYPEVWAEFARLTASGGMIDEFENPILTAAGEERFIAWRNSVLQLGDTVAGTISFGIDITEQRKLEQQLQESLERRGRQVQLATQVAQDIAAAAGLHDLYGRVVTQINQQFGYYYTQLLRYNPAIGSVVLVAGSGAVGARMLAEEHHLPLGVGLIGTAAASGASVLRSNVTADPGWQPNPLLPKTQAELAVPIKLAGQVLGVLDVQSDTAGSLTAEDQLALEGLCGQIAIAIESTRLRQEMEDRLRELGALQRLMSREGWQAFQTRTSEVEGFLFDQLEIHQTTPANILAAAGSQTQAAARPVIAPLAIQGEVIGGLGVYDDPERPLSPEERALLEAMSAQVAESMERARLLEQMQRRAVELAAVAQVSAATATILSPEKLLQTVADLTKIRFSLYHAHIYLLDEAGENLVLAAGAGEVGRQMVGQGWRIPLSRPQSLVAETARTRQGLITNDVRQAPNFLSNPLLPDTRSEMTVPLLAGDRLLGVLDVQAALVNYFSEEDLRIQTTLAAQIAIALQNARLYEQAQSRVRREQVLREITARVRGSTDPDIVIRTAVRELGTALGRPAFVRLGSAEQLQQNGEDIR